MSDKERVQAAVDGLRSALGDAAVEDIIHAIIEMERGVRVEALEEAARLCECGADSLTDVGMPFRQVHTRLAAAIRALKDKP